MLIPTSYRYTTPTLDFCRIDARCFPRDRNYYPWIPYGSGPHCVAILKHPLALCLTFETTATPALSTRRAPWRGADERAVRNTPTGVAQQGGLEAAGSRSLLGDDGGIAGRIDQREQGFEGIVAKRRDSPYKPAQRSAV